MSEWNAGWTAGFPHLVVVSFLLGHRLYSQGSQAEVVLQKQGVDILKWHVALGDGVEVEDVEDLGGSGWGSGGLGLLEWGWSWLPAGGLTPYQPQQSS